MKGPTRRGQSQGTPCPLDLYKYIINPINENPIIPFTFTLNTLSATYCSPLRLRNEQKKQSMTPATSGYSRRPDFLRHLRHQWRPLAGGNNQERELTGVPARNSSSSASPRTQRTSKQEENMDSPPCVETTARSRQFMHHILSRRKDMATVTGSS